jgi:hypothetical protein
MDLESPNIMAVPLAYEENDNFGIHPATKGDREHPNAWLNTWRAYRTLHWPKWWPEDLEPVLPCENPDDEVSSTGAQPDAEGDNEDMLTSASSRRSSSRAIAHLGAARREKLRCPKACFAGLCFTVFRSLWRPLGSCFGIRFGTF